MRPLRFGTVLALSVVAAGGGALPAPLVDAASGASSGVGRQGRPTPASGAPAPGPAEGAVYGGRKGAGEVRMVAIGEEGRRPLLLLDVEVECEIFTPEARVVTSAEEDGRFEVATRATDNNTTDSVAAAFDDIDGRVREDAAVLEIDVEASGEDNAGPTGDCEETQQWKLDARRSRGARRIAGAVAIDADLVAVGADAVYTIRRGAGAANALSRIDPSTLEVDWEIDTSRGASLLGAAGDAVWVLDAERLELSRHDAATGDRVVAIPLDDPAIVDQLASASLSMITTDAAVWVGVDDPPLLYRIDAASNAVTARIDVPGGVRALAAAPDGGVYVSGVDADPATRGGQLLRLDADGTPTAAVSTELLVSGLAPDGTAVWAQDGFGAITGHDPTTLEIRPGSFVPPAGTAAGGIAAAAPGVWVATERGLLALDTELGRAETVPVVGAGNDSPAAGFDAVWVIDAGYLVRVDVT